MIIKKSIFVVSNTNGSLCPPPKLPEYAFTGRSNVGKSSLINMLVGSKKLAKTSGYPGKTQLINHFLINDNWYLVDLPGYGYAKISKDKRRFWDKSIQNYILKRENLLCLFVLIDSRHTMQKNDSVFMEWLGKNKIPFTMVFTKMDKLSNSQLNKNILAYKKEMLAKWEALPDIFITSATTKTGREEILNFIENINKSVKF